MAYSLQTLSGFESFLHANGFDNKSTDEIIKYLESLGYTSQIATDYEPGTSPTFNPGAQVDIGIASEVTFAPTGTQSFCSISTTSISLLRAR